MRTFKNNRPNKCLLNAQIQNLHSQSAKNGFYDDYPTKESRATADFLHSRAMLISGEVAEAYEALRCGKIDNPDEIDNTKALEGQRASFAAAYKTHIKGTVAEELADVYIRLCCVLGALGIGYGDKDINELKNAPTPDFEKYNIHTAFYDLNTLVFEAFDCAPHQMPRHFISIFIYLFHVADGLGIDINAHIELKHYYNTTREYKHGKNY